MLTTNFKTIKKYAAIIAMSSLAGIGVISTIDTHEYMQAAITVIVITGLVNMLLEK